MTPEGRVKHAIKAWLKEEGHWYYMPVQNGMGMMGIPDFIVCWKGRLVGIECKAPGKSSTVTALQARQLERIQDSGGIAFVATSVSEARLILLLNT